MLYPIELYKHTGPVLEGLHHPLNPVFKEHGEECDGIYADNGEGDDVDKKTGLREFLPSQVVLKDQKCNQYNIWMGNHIWI